MNRIILPSHSILLPKYRGIADPQRPIMTGSRGYSGEGRCILYDLNMNIQLDTGWFPNLITNQGLDQIFQGPFYHNYRVYIGSGSTAASFTDTSMETYIAQNDTSGVGDGAQVSGTAPDWEYSQVTSKRFYAGNGVGTVREIAMGQSDNDTGSNIFNHVILGTPIDKGVDNVLDVLFRLTVWPPTSDVNGTATIEGVSYDTIVRGSKYPVGLGSGTLSTAFAVIRAKTSYSAHIAYNGDIDIIENYPTGATDQAENGTWGLSYSTYNDTDKFIDITVSSGLNGWVVSGNEIRSIYTGINKSAIQTQFNATSGGAKIPKDNTEVMDFTWRISWDRV